MKFSRAIPVRSRIITEVDFVRFLQFFEAEYVALSPSSKHISLRFNARFDDNTSIESDDSAEFAASSSLKTRRAVSLDLSINDHQNHHNVTLSLSHGNSEYGDSISIHSADENWVSALSARLKESIDACPPQQSFALKYERPLEFIAALSIGRLYRWILDLLFLLVPIQPLENPPAWALSMRDFFLHYPIVSALIDYAIMLMVGWFPSVWLFSKVEHLWPSIEFQIGPAHTLIEKQRRKLLSAIFTVGILPILLSLVYDIIKAIK